MARRVAFAGAIVAVLAVLAIGVWGFGRGSGPSEPALPAFCTLDSDLRSEALADPEGFDTMVTTPAGRERLQELVDRAPAAVADDVRVVVESVQELGHGAFADPSIHAAADRVDAWVDRACSVRATTTLPFPFADVPGAPGVPFECPPGFVRVEGMSGVYHDLLDALRMTGDWVDTHEGEQFLMEQIPDVEGFEGMGGVICLPAEGTGVDVDEVLDHMERYIPEGIPGRP